MSDIQLAVLLASLAGLAWYIGGGLEREIGPSGVLNEEAAAVSDRGSHGLRHLLWGHFFNLLACIPLLAYSPFLLEEGHDMGRWLAEYAVIWLRWAGLVQLLYLVPLWKRLRGESRPKAARTLALGGAMTLAVSGLSWAIVWYHRPGTALSLQAAAGILGMSAAVALLWSARELRRSLRD